MNRQEPGNLKEMIEFQGTSTFINFESSALNTFEVFFGIKRQGSICFFLFSAFLFLFISSPRAGEVNVGDPNTEFVLVNIGGVDFDIPLGYFYEKYLWGKGKWPIPKNERTQQPSMSISAYIPGMKPWSKALDDEFKFRADRLNISRMVLHKAPSSDWLNNFLRGKGQTQRPSSEFGNLSHLKGYTSDDDKNETYYLPEGDVFSYQFSIRCTKINPNPRYCEATFTYRKGVVVQYLIPIPQLQKWRMMHDDVIRMLDGFVKN